MFETRWPLKPTAWALHEAPVETTYADCWQGLKDEFKA
jgi:homogentisate 1,2-dioxygenase